MHIVIEKEDKKMAVYSERDLVYMETRGWKEVNTKVDFTPKPTPSIEEQYIAKFGKAPHHRMKVETILEKLKG